MSTHSRKDQGKITVLRGTGDDEGFDGPFLDGEPGVADFLDALG